jgi:hypothetical protein
VNKGNTFLQYVLRFPKLIFERSPGLAICPSGKGSSTVKISTEHWWDDTDRRKQKYWKKTLS